MTTRSRLARWELWGLVALLLLAFALRIVALGDVPPGLRYDELLNYRMAQRVVAGERPLYFTESWGEEPLFMYVQALVIGLTQPSDWAIRLPAVFFGVLSVLTAWLAARRLFGARVAMLTAAALTVSFWSLFYSRQGLRVLSVTPFHSLAVYFLWRGLERRLERPLWRAAGYFSLAGASLGAAFYVYPAARLMPLLPAGVGLYWILFRRRADRRLGYALLVAAVVAVALAAPILYVIYGQPQTEQRIGQLTGAWEALRVGNPLPVLRLALQAVGMFLWRGEQDWLYNVHGRPIFDPLTGACFLLGVGLALWRWRKPASALLLLWLGLGLAPAMLVPPPASLSHSIAAQPPAYILLALGLDALWRRVRRWRAWAAPALAACLIAFHGALSLRAYFGVWAHAPEVRELHQGGVTAVARQLDAEAPPGPVAVGAPYVNYWHPWNAVAFDLALYRRDLNVRWFDPSGGWVWPAGAGPTTFYFPVDPLGPQSFDPALRALFSADAVLLPGADDDFSAFRVADPAAFEAHLAALPAPSLAWPPGQGDRPAPQLPLDFGGRFALLGVEPLAGRAAPGETVRLVTYWRALRADPAPVVAFAHLTADGQDIWAQEDWLDVRPSSLRPGDRFAQVHELTVDPETPPGVYHVQLGFYGPDTLVRLPVRVDGEAVGDRVWVGAVRIGE